MVPVEFSAGWKEYELGLTSKELMEAADRALYENKRGARSSGATPPGISVSAGRPVAT
jgi:PleD family two-component response regulator